MQSFMAYPTPPTRVLRIALGSVIPNGVFRWTVILTAFPRLAIGAPLPTYGLVAMDADTASATLNSLANLAVLVLVLPVLGAAQLLVRLNADPLAVWGTWMGCSAFGWWNFRNDFTISIVLYCAVFFVWMISTDQYARYGFEGLKAQRGIRLAIICMAAVLDVLIVHLTPKESLNNLSLPMVSIVLVIAQVGLSVYRHPYSQPLRSDNEFPLQETPQGL